MTRSQVSTLSWSSAPIPGKNLCGSRTFVKRRSLFYQLVCQDHRSGAHQLVCQDLNISRASFHITSRGRRSGTPGIVSLSLVSPPVTGPRRWRKDREECCSVITDFFSSIKIQSGSPNRSFANSLRLMTFNSTFWSPVTQSLCFGGDQIRSAQHSSFETDVSLTHLHIRSGVP